MKSVDCLNQYFEERVQLFVRREGDMSVGPPVAIVSAGAFVFQALLAPRLEERLGSFPVSRPLCSGRAPLLHSWLLSASLFVGEVLTYIGGDGRRCLVGRTAHAETALCTVTAVSQRQRMLWIPQPTPNLSQPTPNLSEAPLRNLLPH